jgi:hypothetical protein
MTIAFSKSVIFLNRMNFEDKTMTMAITNPEVRYEFDYATKGVMFLMPIDTSGPALITASECCYITHQR